MDNNTTRLNNVIDELLTHQEDGQKLAFWQKIFPQLSLDQQEELLQILEQELTALQALD